MCVLVWRLCCVCMRIWRCLYGDCLCLRGRMHICECACLYGDCVVFVCVPGHVCMVVVCVCVGVFMFVNVCVCMVGVLCLYVILAIIYGDCGCLRRCMHVCKCV